MGCVTFLKIDLRYIKAKRNFLDLFPGVLDKE